MNEFDVRPARDGNHHPGSNRHRACGAPRSSSSRSCSASACRRRPLPRRRGRARCPVWCRWRQQHRLAARPPTIGSGSGATLHALGGVLTPGLQQGARHSPPAWSKWAASYPTSVDLSAWAPPVGNQGSVGSCVSWATGYYDRYWLRNRAIGETTTYVPTYLYSQIAQGTDNGSLFPQNFNILTSQGIAPQSSYPQGNFDDKTQPTLAEQEAAAPDRTTSDALLFAGAGGGDYQAATEAALASGAPVLLMIPVYPVRRGERSNPWWAFRLLGRHPGEPRRLRAEVRPNRCMDRELLGHRVGSKRLG